MAPDPGTWTHDRVHRDCHIQFEYCYDSVPFALIGQDLWLRGELLQGKDLVEMTEGVARQTQPMQKEITNSLRATVLTRSLDPADATRRLPIVARSRRFA
jgi:hypothetical protein